MDIYTHNKHKEKVSFIHENMMNSDVKHCTRKTQAHTYIISTKLTAFSVGY